MSNFSAKMSPVERIQNAIAQIDELILVYETAVSSVEHKYEITRSVAVPLTESFISDLKELRETLTTSKPVQTLVGTRWRCIDADHPKAGLVGTVTHGEIDPSSGGDNEIELTFGDGSTHSTKFRRLSYSFKPEDPKTTAELLLHRGIVPISTQQNPHS